MKPVAAIFDIGKTNKKLFLFDEDYHIVEEYSTRFDEISDEDGFPCEDIKALKNWLTSQLKEKSTSGEFDIRAVNFSAYGASLVYLDESGQTLTPLYNYLKPYPENLAESLYQNYGGKEAFSIATASPALGSLNSGLQLYRLKKEQTHVFQNVKYALHLPQYLSSIVSGRYVDEITSIGCHTAIWDFQKADYHQWVRQEGITAKFPAIVTAQQTIMAGQYCVGSGLHDSSAALIPYLQNFKEPFVLLSTGTWAISLNPFNHIPLTGAELAQDCLCYLQYTGKPVKASRLFSGHEHEEQVKRIAAHFNRQVSAFNNLPFDPDKMTWLEKNITQQIIATDNVSGFKSRALAEFKDAAIAYHQLIIDLVKQQVKSTQLVMQGPAVNKIFVDGGFSRNEIYMQLLARQFPDIEVYAATVAQATALGAALVIANSWNSKGSPDAPIMLRRYH